MAQVRSALAAVSINAANLTTALKEAASSQHQLQLVVKWSKGKPVSLFLLHVQRGSKWEQILENVLADNDGDVEFDMGKFNEGDIKIKFGLFPYEDVAKCAVFVVQDNDKVTRIWPDDPKETDELKRSEPMRATKDYVVG